MSRPPFERLTIIGLGLLGGSVGLAARARAVAREVVGVGRSRESREEALRRGAVDRIASGSEAVRGASLVVLATPVGAMAEELAGIAPALARGTLVTDVGSVKGCLAEVLPGLLPPGTHYVGAHPMAGSHHRGVAHARSDLFEGAACIVTPVRETDPSALDAVAGFWRALGGTVILRDPHAHDVEAAWVSHLPHALAFAYAGALDAAPASAGEVTGNGFRDFTRIARSDAELWSEILLANRKALAGPVQRASEGLAALAAALDTNDGDELSRLIADARGRLSAFSAAAPARDESRPSGGEYPDNGGAKFAAPERNERSS